jgi:hypothetical protein
MIALKKSESATGAVYKNANKLFARIIDASAYCLHIILQHTILPFITLRKIQWHSIISRAGQPHNATLREK